MSHPKTVCNVCGHSEFFLDAGSFFCLECNTQTQDLREEVYDDWVGGTNLKVAARVVQKTPQKNSLNLEGKERLSSWEVLNYVLKGLVDELIDLGAEPRLKQISLQLWASYLSELDIAFTSTDVERKPRLGYSFKSSDAELLYGVTKKQLTEKSWMSRRRSGSDSDHSSKSSKSKHSAASEVSNRGQRIRLGFSKKALAKIEYSQSQDTVKTFSQTLEELDSASASEAAETPKRLKVTKHTRMLLSSSCASSTEDDRSVKRRTARREVSSLRNVTTAKVVALVNIALSLTDSGIQLSDFLRWVEEGHLSLKTSRRFLPEDTVSDLRVQQSMELGHLSYVKCQGLVSEMCKQLEIDHLPTPDLTDLAARYCLELQLPDEMTQMVQRLVVLMTSYNGRNERRRRRGFVAGTGEVEVMAAIVVTMKLLFSLDDCTEYQLSHTAHQINRASREMGESGPVLFVWSDWQQLIECRKAVLAALHLPTRRAVYETREIGRDPELFLQHHLLTKANTNLQSSDSAQNKHMLNKNFVEAVTKLLQNLVESVTEPGIDFPPSVTPLHSYTQVLLTEHSHRVAPVLHILQTDYTKHSLQHLLYPDLCAARCLASDLNIVQRNGVATCFQIAKLNPRETDSLVIPRYRLNLTKTSVKIVNSLVKQTKKVNRFLTDTSQSELDEPNDNLNQYEDIISEDSDEDDEHFVNDLNYNQEYHNPMTSNDNCLDIFKTSSQYWLTHFSTGKNSLTLEEFDTFSMKEFPCSFLWFLKECSRVIKVHPKTLYTSVIQLENQNKHLLNEAYYLTRISGKRKRV